MLVSLQWHSPLILPLSDAVSETFFQVMAYSAQTADMVSTYI